MWVLRNWLRAVMFSGGLEGGYVGAPTYAFRILLSLLVSEGLPIILPEST